MRALRGTKGWFLLGFSMEFLKLIVIWHCLTYAVQDAKATFALYFYYFCKLYFKYLKKTCIFEAFKISIDLCCALIFYLI